MDPLAQQSVWLANAPDPDPETLCTVCGNDTPTVRCCGQDLDYERTDDH